MYNEARILYILQKSRHRDRPLARSRIRLRRVGVPVLREGPSGSPCCRRHVMMRGRPRRLAPAAIARRPHARGARWKIGAVASALPAVWPRVPRRGHAAVRAAAPCEALPGIRVRPPRAGRLTPRLHSLVDLNSVRAFGQSF